MDMTEATATDEVVIPRWQPDNDLPGCSICGNTFTFLNRRHHCRRCGRLVCGPCSPHRITIPRQYIVRPAEEEQDLRPRSRSNTASSDPLENPALGGGETVRVCNPCVPDPNYGLPPQHAQQLSSPPLASRSRAQTYAPENSSGLGFSRVAGQVLEADLTSTTSRSAPLNTRTLSSYVGSSSQQGEERAAYRPRLHTARYQALNSVPRRPPAAAQGSRAHSDNDTSNVSRTRCRTLSYTPDRLAESGAQPQSQSHAIMNQPARQRRRDAPSEEHECPVCGTRNYPFGESGTSEERERHVEFCISSHLAGSSRAQAAAPAEAVDSTSTATEGEGVQTSSSATAPQRASSVLGASTARQRMLVYNATEKDCFDEDGEAQECVICFEEFEEGVQMGRLECLCKFHRTCIRGWWEQRGKGTCPTHQLHD